MKTRLTIVVHLLVEYFCRRLENAEDSLNNRAGIKESGEALLALARMTDEKMRMRLPPGDVATIAKAVFAVPGNGNLRSQMGSTRVVLYELLSELMDAYKPNLIKDVGPKEFVQGVVLVAEPEKDPSCLKLLFGMYEDLGRHWELSPDTSLLIWDSFSRYFPITLGGAARDPSIPTPVELRALLLNCFTSNDSYAKHAFPRLMDMLDTNQDLSANVKVILSLYFTSE
jgi:DNA repair/transcription protein MET18/MMS19